MAIILNSPDSSSHEFVRAGSIGAEVQPNGGVHFRVWAPKCRRVEVVLLDAEKAFELTAEANGYFSGYLQEAGDGNAYSFRLDGAEGLCPDPASRFQPEGPHGASLVVDASRFKWTDEEWKGVSVDGQVIYEMHIGTFTREGTYAAAMRELPELAATGITVLELMPLADFPGEFGWGYDGVDMFAPTRLYGTPDELRAFIDRAHGCGMGVILDVVYNHLGPDGNYLKLFSDSYFSNKYENEWGEAINFDGEDCGGVREFFLENAKYWIREFHFDGLRLDATQQIFDDSETHILREIGEAVRASANGRGTLIVAENETQQTRLVRASEEGGYALDGLWNDDFHHSAVVALTGHNEAYYTDHLASPQEFISAIKYGYLFQGQFYKWQSQRRGSSALDLEPTAFVNFIENHDQVANSATGARLWQLSHPGRYRAMTALLLLAPQTPMIFQGQEFSASAPFLYFADHNRELAAKVDEGRKDFLQQFRNIASSEVGAMLSTASERSTFERCKLDFAEREKHAQSYDLHKDLLALRRETPDFRSQRRGGVDGAVLGAAAFVLRFFGEDGNDRLLLVNLGRDLNLNPAPEPLLAPPHECEWYVAWSSEDPKYGGAGTAPLETEYNWRIPGESAVVMAPREAGRRPDRRTSERRIRNKTFR